MGVRVVIGAIVSAVALLVWGFLFWVVLSAPGNAVRALPDETAWMQALREQLPASGSYVFPYPPRPKPGQEQGAELEAFRERHSRGPVGLLAFNRDGADPLSPLSYLTGLLHFFVASLVAALLLAQALPVLESFGRRVAFVFGLGVFAALAVRPSDVIWWHLPWSQALHGAVYDGLTWLIGALVLAAIVHPCRRTRHLTDSSKPLWKRALEVD